VGLQRPVPLAAEHRIESFRSGAAALDRWLRRHALQSQRSGTSRVFVTTDRGLDVFGYYTLSLGAVMGPVADPPLPVFLLGRMAVDARRQGRHPRRALLLDAMTRVQRAAQPIGVRGLIVHAIDASAREWYEEFGFEPSPTHPLHLLLSIKDLHTTIEAFESH
jgi:hypothetical protein